MRKRIDPIIQKMRSIFNHSFDRAWFYSMLNNVPLELKEIREMREFIQSEINHHYDSQEIAERVAGIDKFLGVIHTHMIPELKEKLRISYLNPDNMVEDKDELITRQFIAYTLPHNLKEFDRLNAELKKMLAQDLEDKISIAPAI